MYWLLEEKLDICKLMATDRPYTERYRTRRLTIVAKTWKILQENGQHGHEEKDAWRSVYSRSYVDEQRIFGLGRQQSEKAMLVTRPMLILLYPDCDFLKL